MRRGTAADVFSPSAHHPQSASRSSWRGRRKRNHQFGNGALLVAEEETLLVAVKALQTRARIGKADSMTVRCRGFRVTAGIMDLQPQLFRVAHGADRDAARRSEWSNSVADGILDERLQNQAGYFCRQSIFGDRPFDIEPIAKAHLFDFQVSADEGNFFGERNFLGALRLQ